MKWINESADNPGFSVWHTNPERDPNTLYVVRQKRKTKDFSPTGWRVFVRNSPTEALRTIYMADTLKEGKAFVEDLEKVIAEA